jgi:hypothetical protein
MTVKKIILTCIFTFAALVALGRLFEPKHMSRPYEGALTGEYYLSEKNHSLLIIGDCEVHENISPITLWDEFGITSYIRGGAQQLVWHSYYLLEDALRYETPEAVLFSVQAMRHGEPQREEYNRLNIGGMRLSTTKLRAISASRMPGESYLSYLFPLLRYHDRWRELSSDDFRYYFGTSKRVSHNGYMMRCDVMPAGVFPRAPRLPDYRFSDKAYYYLDRIRELCEENGIHLVLLKAPVLFPHWYDEWDEQITAYAEKHGLLYINALSVSDDIGIDFGTDTYNAGLHLNVNGAEKLAAYLGAVLRESFDLPDDRSNPELSAVWARKQRAYNEMKHAQNEDIKNHGEVRTFLFEVVK